MKTGDILTIQQVKPMLDNKLGFPGPADIATSNGKWFPVGFCTDVGSAVEDPDGVTLLKYEEYGSNWIAVYTGDEIEGWRSANAGFAALLDC